MNVNKYWENISDEMKRKGIKVVEFNDVPPYVYSPQYNETCELLMIVRSENDALFFVPEKGNVFTVFPNLNAENALIVNKAIYGDTFGFLSSDNFLIEVYDNFVDALKTFYEKRNLVYWPNAEDTIHYKLSEMFSELEGMKPTEEIVN